ncbi:MAG: 6-phosphogluconolactonase [Halocynthiibacter sp.]
MEKIKYSDREALEMGLAERIADDLKQALHQKDRVTFAVAGGQTPRPVYELLGGVSMDWDRVDVVLTDERWVPETDPMSNAAMIRESLLQGHAAAAVFHPIYRDGDKTEAIRAAATDVGPFLPIDVALLGMGTDMHTASLFPDDVGLSEAFDLTGPIFVPATSPSGDARVSMGAATLNTANEKHLMIVGKSKKKALKQARKITDPVTAPIMALAHGLVVHWAK